MSEDNEAKPPTPKRGQHGSPNHLRVGYNQVNDFYTTFQRLDRAVEFGEHKKSSKVAYMREAEKRKLYPNPSGIVAFSGKNRTIDASHHYMGNSRVAAFSKGLTYTEARHVDLQSNNISGIGGRSVILSLCPKMNAAPPQILTLNLENNNLGRGNEFIRELSNQFEDRKFPLRELNLSSNQINDNQIEILCEGLIEGNSGNLTKLNLSKNLITDAGAASLVELFKQSDTKLSELYLGWNKITGPGACSIADIMGMDTRLRVIDLCWNGLGQGLLTPGTVGQRLGGAIK